MKKLLFSVANHPAADMAELYQSLASSTIEKLNTQLRVDVIPWEDLWYYVQSKSMALSGLDVSEVGTTWLGSLADADALATLSDDFIQELHGSSRFSEKAWQPVEHIGGKQVRFLPFMLDIRMIYYWRDHLEKAGIGEETAFATIENVQETFAKLRAAGMPGWGAQTFHSNNTLYHISSWIWATGKDYLSKDEKRTAFCEPEVLEAIRAYFELASFMDRSFDNHGEVSAAFERREITACMNGPWVWSALYQNRSQTNDVEKIGVALPPGPPFLGGAALMISNHARGDIIEPAQVLLDILTSASAQRRLHDLRGMLPVHREVLNDAPFNSDENFRAMSNAMSAARYLPSATIWGPLESSLIRAFGLIWGTLKGGGRNVKPGLLERHLEPLARRFDRMIEIF